MITKLVQLLQNGGHKCQQNPGVFLQGVWIFKTHIRTFTYGKGEIRNAILTLKQRWNEFIFRSASELNEVFDWYRWKKNILKNRPLFGKSFPIISALRREKTECGERTSTELNSLLNGQILINPLYTAKLG